MAPNGLLRDSWNHCNIEPGAIQTDFENSMKFVGNAEYNEYLEQVNTNMMASYTNAPKGDAVAKMVFKAANDSSYKLRYQVAFQSKMLLLLRAILPERWFYAMVSSVAEKGIKKK
jgi:hypothetical protein